jgi:hypothetical protein
LEITEGFVEKVRLVHSPTVVNKELNNTKHIPVKSATQTSTIQRDSQVCTAGGPSAQSQEPVLQAVITQQYVMDILPPIFPANYSQSPLKQPKTIPLYSTLIKSPMINI